jgi:hypothetical protein
MLKPKGRLKMSDEAILKCQQTLRDLTKQRDKLAARVERIGEDRKKAGIALFIDDGGRQARKRLDELNLESAAATGELEALDAAITEAKRRLQLAQQDEQSARDKEAAFQVREHAAKASEFARLADTHFSNAIDAVCGLFQEAREMHRCGEQHPSELQLASNVSLAMKTAFMNLPPPVARTFEFLGPDRRKTFRGFWEAMHSPIEWRVKQKLNQTDEAA